MFFTLSISFTDPKFDIIRIILNSQATIFNYDSLIPSIFCHILAVLNSLLNSFTLYSISQSVRAGLMLNMTIRYTRVFFYVAWEIRGEIHFTMKIK